MKKHPAPRAASGKPAAAAHPAPKPETPDAAAPAPSNAPAPTPAELLARLAALETAVEQAEREQAERANAATGEPQAEPPAPRFDFSPRESDTVPDALPQLPAQGWIQADSFEAYNETPDGEAIADRGFGAAHDFIPWKRAVLRFPLYYRATGLFYKDGKPFVWYEFTPEPFAALRGHDSPDSFLLARPLESLESEPRPVAV